MGGEEEHSLARNLLNFEARDRRLCRGGERRSLACPRQINHRQGDIPKANYMKCFLGKSSSRLCKSSQALAEFQMCLGRVACQCTPVSGGRITEGYSGYSRGFLRGQMLSLLGESGKQNCLLWPWNCRTRAVDQVLLLNLLYNFQTLCKWRLLSL